MPASGGKAYLLLVEDVKGLAETDEYRSDKVHRKWIFVLKFSSFAPQLYCYLFIL